MNLRNLVALATLALAVVLALMTFIDVPTKAAPAVCTVPGTHASIQSAVNDLTCTTINVAAGTYVESVNIPAAQAGLTINGAQTGNNDFTTRNANPAGESTVNGANPTASVAVFTVDAANVTINGFTIKNSVTSGAAHGVAVRGGGNSASILNNIF